MQFHGLILLVTKTESAQVKKTWCYFCLILYSSISTKESIKLVEILEKLKNSQTLKQQGANKASFTKNFKRLVNTYGISFARRTYLGALGIYLLEKPDDHLLQFLYRRIEPKLGDYFRCGGDTYGWFDEAYQIMAERIPLYVCLNEELKKVDFESFYYEREYWNKRGFYEAESIAYVYKTGKPGESAEALEIEIRRDDLEQHGFAKSEDLFFVRDSQWEDGEKFYFWNVKRKEKEFGFWQAYKWWAGCESWYEERHPEWFDVNDEFHERELIHKEILSNGQRLLLKRNAAIIDSFILSRKNKTQCQIRAMNVT